MRHPIRGFPNKSIVPICPSCETGPQASLSTPFTSAGTFYRCSCGDSGYSVFMESKLGDGEFAQCLREGKQYHEMGNIMVEVSIPDKKNEVMSLVDTGFDMKNIPSYDQKVTESNVDTCIHITLTDRDHGFPELETTDAFKELQIAWGKCQEEIKKNWILDNI